MYLESTHNTRPILIISLNLICFRFILFVLFYYVYMKNVSKLNSEFSHQEMVAPVATSVIPILKCTLSKSVLDNLDCQVFQNAAVTC